MKIISWNVNGVRATVKKGLVDRFNEMEPDVLCLQETKAQDEQVEEALQDLSKHHLCSFSAVKKGYSGTANISITTPLCIKQGLGIEEHDQQGRVLTTEYKDCYVVNVYVPNSGNGLIKLPYRETWDAAFLGFLKNLEKTKPLVVLGDFNVAHQEIDLARPQPNYNKTAGYTQTEIDGLSLILSNGFKDTFRELHPNTIQYSWWSFRGGARERNVGWRLDYVLVSEALFPKVKSAFVLPNIHGSDHCPVGIELDI